MIYLVNNNKYSLSYRELREKYHELSFLPLEEFLERLPEVLHFCCMICYLKEVSNEKIVGDEGIIHRIAHLMHLENEPLIVAQGVKEQFVTEMRIV